MFAKPEIILVGGGGHCHSVIDILEKEDRSVIAGIIDLPERLGQKVLGYTVIGKDDDLAGLRKIYKYAIITLGQIKTSIPRQRLYNQLKQLGYQLPTIISPLAYVSKHAKIGEGTVVMHHALVNANANIGNNCIINSKVLIEHDAVIKNNCHIATAAVINGGAKVLANSFVGSNSVVVQGGTVKGFIKAGSLVK